MPCMIPYATGAAPVTVLYGILGGPDRSPPMYYWGPSPYGDYYPPGLPSIYTPLPPTTVGYSPRTSRSPCMALAVHWYLGILSPPARSPGYPCPLQETLVPIVQ
jgi:hypothetical protein